MKMYWIQPKQLFKKGFIRKYGSHTSSSKSQATKKTRWWCGRLPADQIEKAENIWHHFLFVSHCYEKGIRPL